MSTQTRRLACLLAAAGLLAAIAVSSVTPAIAATECSAGTGKQLDHRTITSELVKPQDELACANLSGSDLSGLDLTQVTLDRANLSGANLSNANLTQASLKGADLSNANLSHADLSQAELTNAKLDGADLSGAQLTEATLTGATFTGVKGLLDWSLILLIGAGVVILLLAVRAVRRARSGGRSLAKGLAGAVLVGLGLHLMVGAFLGEMSFAFAAAVQAMCSGPQCALGVNAGFLGIFGGVLVLIVGGGLSAMA